VTGDSHKLSREEDDTPTTRLPSEYDSFRIFVRHAYDRPSIDLSPRLAPLRTHPLPSLDIITNLLHLIRPLERLPVVTTRLARLFVRIALRPGAYDRRTTSLCFRLDFLHFPRPLCHSYASFPFLNFGPSPLTVSYHTYHILHFTSLPWPSFPF